MSVAKLFKLFFASHEFGGTKTEKIVKKMRENQRSGDESLLMVSQIEWNPGRLIEYGERIVYQNILRLSHLEFVQCRWPAVFFSISKLLIMNSGD